MSKKSKPTIKNQSIRASELTIDEANRPVTDVSMLISMVIGFLFTLLVVLLAFLLKGVSKWFYEIIMDRGPIQFFTLFFAGFVLGHIIQKFNLVGRQQLALEIDPVPDGADLSNEASLTGIRKELRGYPMYESSLLLNRIDRLLAQYLGIKDVPLVAGWANNEADRDYDGSASSHVLANVALAMIPLLGFIGTVMGLSTSVAKFSEFLTGDVELEKITAALKDVTGGLGTAFDTTLLALVLSLILSFPLALVVRRENTVLSEFDSYVDDRLISRFPPPEPTTIRIENLEDAIDSAFRRYIPDPDRYDEVFSRAIAQAGNTVEDKFANLVASYESAVTDMTNRLAASLTSAGDSVEASMRSVVSDVQQQDELMVHNRKKIAAEETDRLKVLLDEYQTGASALTTATTQNLMSSTEAANSLSQRLEQVKEMSHKLEEMLKLQDALDKSLSGLSTSDEFKQTLGDLRKHLETTDQFCQEMRKPRTITLREEY